MEALLKPDFGLMFWTVVNFLLLVFVLGKFAWKPVIKALEDRENKLAADKLAAETARDEAQKIQAELKTRLDNLAAEAHAKMKQVEALASSQKQEIINEAKKSSAQILEAAKAEIEAEKQHALRDVKKEIASVALLAAGQLAKVKVDAKADKTLVDNIIRDISESK